MKKTIAPMVSEYVAPEIEVLKVTVEAPVLESSTEGIGDDEDIN